jgi:hypothetical protein
VAGIVGLWADIDIAGEGHQKSNLPPDSDSAILLAYSMGLAPSITLHSGGGIQCWWLFDEPWIFVNNDDRNNAKELSDRWTRTLRSKAEEQGWTIDGTQDLSRVLRVLGTNNCKQKGNPRPVTIVEAPLKRYNPEEFRPLLTAQAGLFASTKVEPARVESVAFEPGRKAEKAAGAIILSASAEFNCDKWELLCELEPRASAAYNHKRNDMSDQSMSSFDLSIATYAYSAGWTDQEVADLLISHRRKWGSLDKAMREDYILMTLARAKEGAVQLPPDTIEAVGEVAATIQEEIKQGEIIPEAKDEDRGKLIETLKEGLGLPIKRVVKQISDPPQYLIEAPGYSIKLGGIETVLNQNQFRARVADASRIILSNIRKSEWTGLAQTLLYVAEEESIGDEATDRGRAELWVTQYLRVHTPVEDWEEAFDRQQPIVHGGQVCFSGPDLRKWIGLALNEKVRSLELGQTLKTIGAETCTIQGQVNGKIKSRTVWRLPVSLSNVIINLLKG